MVTLGVDTSNYATSLALVDHAGQEVVCAKKQILPVKKGQLGLRQSDAVFHHTVTLPILTQELAQEGCFEKYAIEAVGVSEKPRPVEGSYMPCFLAGVGFATAFSAARQIPLIKTTHQQGHIEAARFAAKQQGLPDGKALFFHVSGGTTDLLLIDGWTVEKTLGTSNDLYAGQAVDRLGTKLGFSFPCGEELSDLAARCSEEIQPKVAVKNGRCSLSGLENQCDKLLKEGRPPAFAAKYCLLYIAETALQMIQFTQSTHPEIPVICAGGVMSSSVIKSYILDRFPEYFFVPPVFSSDNAIGVASIAAQNT